MTRTRTMAVVVISTLVVVAALILDGAKGDDPEPVRPKADFELLGPKTV